MFTGIVTSRGALRERSDRSGGARLVIAIPDELGPLAIGESVCVHGVCLTVQAIRDGAFEADASAETLARTTLGAKQVGARLHLERALTLADRLGGHLVSGHVDGVALVRQKEPVGDSLRLGFEVDAELAPYIAYKGSVAIDGVSLTSNRVAGREFEVMIIPHTRNVTSLGELAVGDQVNIEVDLLARYVARLLSFSPAPAGSVPHAHVPSS